MLFVFCESPVQRNMCVKIEKQDINYVGKYIGTNNVISAFVTNDQGYEGDLVNNENTPAGYMRNDYFF